MYLCSVNVPMPTYIVLKHDGHTLYSLILVAWHIVSHDIKWSYVAYILVARKNERNNSFRYSSIEIII